MAEPDAIDAVGRTDAMTSPTRARLLVWQDPLATFRHAQNLSGLEYLQAIVRGRLAPPPFMALLRMEALSASHGEVVAAGLPSEEHYTLSPMVNNGYAGTLLGAAMSFAVRSTLPAGRELRTYALEVTLLKEITGETGRVIARGTVVERVAHRARAEGTLVAESDGRRLATGSIKCVVTNELDPVGPAPGAR